MAHHLKKFEESLISQRDKSRRAEKAADDRYQRGFHAGMASMAELSLALLYIDTEAEHGQSLAQQKRAAGGVS